MDTLIDLTTCILWTGRINVDGYGTIGIHLAHRRAYEDQVGPPIPKGYVLDHVCNVRACINVLHLEPVTQPENVRRTNERGRHRSVQITHCPQGHDYARHGRRTPDKRLYCRVCKTVKSRERRARLNP